jgi:hypothetical protein
MDKLGLSCTWTRNADFSRVHDAPKRKRRGFRPAVDLGRALSG